MSINYHQNSAKDSFGNTKVIGKYLMKHKKDWTNLLFGFLPTNTWELTGDIWELTGSNTVIIFLVMAWYVFNSLLLFAFLYESDS